MKEKLTKLSKLQRILLITIGFELVLAIFSCIGFFFNQPGWLIGVLIGGFAATISVLLSQVGASLVLKESKPGLFLLFNFAKVLVFLGLFTMLVVFQYILSFDIFTNSFWGYIIGFAPSTLITISLELVDSREDKAGK